MLSIYIYEQKFEIVCACLRHGLTICSLAYLDLLACMAVLFLFV